jgi:HlyD family secretion protein
MMQRTRSVLQRIRRLLVALLLLLGAVGAGAAAYHYLQPVQNPYAFQGWVEAYLIFLSPDEAGRIEKLYVREGDTVTAGKPMFDLDADLQRAAVAENQAAVANAQVTFDRARELLQRSVGSQKAYDDAEANLRTAQARLNSAKTRLDRRRVFAPVAGAVQEIYFRAGEQVAAGRPIISLLPPENVRVRFFVPQAMLPKISIGERIAVQCDGCPANLMARVNFISAQAEFTPPVIYSQEERARLVFRVEALPERPGELRVGQPISIALQPAPGVNHASR